MNDLEIIARCVRECASARDERGRWRQERRLADELRSAGSTETISTLTAKAAAEVGRAIAAMGAELARDGKVSPTGFVVASDSGRHEREWRLER